MITVVDGVYSRVNINQDDTDTDDVKKYKDLLNKEYSFCLKIIDEVILRIQPCLHLAIESKSGIFQWIINRQSVQTPLGIRSSPYPSSAWLLKFLK